MKNKVLKKEPKKKKIENISLPIEGLHMKPKLQNHQNLVTVHEIILVSDELKKNMIGKQCDRSFRKLVALILDIEESDNAMPSDCAIALNEISKVESMMAKKFQKELNQKEYEKWQKKLFILKKKLKEKLLEMRNQELLKKMLLEQERTEEKGKSR